MLVNTATLSSEVEAALQRMGNNGPLFAPIAGQFIEKLGLFSDELRAFLENGAIPEATNLHELKAFADTFGNVPLAEMASRLETELKRTSYLPDPGNVLARLASLLSGGCP